MTGRISELTKKLSSLNWDHGPNLINHSCNIKKDDIFFAYPGSSSDGRNFIEEAIGSGTSLVVWDDKDFIWKKKWNVENFPVRNLKKQLGRIASAYYGDPTDNLWVAGVTGTNGKTSCVNWISSCLNKLGYPTGSIGTLGVNFGQQTSPTVNTTPDAMTIQRVTAELLQKKATGIALEASSHGLDQGRLSCVRFDVGLFTNLSRDHLDYHGDMGRYGQAKKILFASQSLESAVVNIDDSFGDFLFKDIEKALPNAISYGSRSGDIHSLNVRERKWGTSFDVSTPWGRTRVESKILGDHNLYNFLGVIGVLCLRGIDVKDVGAVISTCEPIPGRMENINFQGKPLVVIDYAHTPEALRGTLQALGKLLESTDKLICVFGCGGSRDKGKRAEMGAVASSLADYCFVTSDNPRNESPTAIIKDILKGMDSNYTVEKNRKSAIVKSLEFAKENDIALIAGKGHENYQDFGNKKVPFSDHEIVQAYLRKTGRGGSVV